MPEQGQALPQGGADDDGERQQRAPDAHVGRLQGAGLQQPGGGVQQAAQRVAAAGTPPRVRAPGRLDRPARHRRVHRLGQLEDAGERVRRAGLPVADARRLEPGRDLRRVDGGRAQRVVPPGELRDRVAAPPVAPGGTRGAAPVRRSGPLPRHPGGQLGDERAAVERGGCAHAATSCRAGATRSSYSRPYVPSIRSSWNSSSARARAAVREAGAQAGVAQRALAARRRAPPGRAAVPRARCRR